MPPLKDLLEVLLGTVLPALAAAALVMAAVERLGDARQASSGAALGLVAGVAVGLWLRGVVPLTPPAELAWNRLPWAAGLALCVGRVARLLDSHAGDGWLLRAGASGAIAWWVVPASAQDLTPWLVPAFACAIWANWMLLDLCADQPASASVAVAAILAVVVAGGVLLFASIAKLMETSVVLASAFAGVVLVAQWRRVEFGGAVPALAVALPGLLVMGHQTTSVTAIHGFVYALPALAPLLLAVTFPFLDGPRGRLHVLRIAIVLVPLLVAMILVRLQAGPLDVGAPEW